MANGWPARPITLADGVKSHEMNNLEPLSGAEHQREVSARLSIDRRVAHSCATCTTPATHAGAKQARNGSGGSGTILAMDNDRESAMKNEAQGVSRHNPLRTVAVIARDPQPAVLDALLEAGDYDVVFMESIERAYSIIKRATPDLVIVCLGIDDLDSFQLLSMLALDSETAHIPICTYVAPPPIAESAATSVRSVPHASARSLGATMN